MATPDSDAGTDTSPRPLPVTKPFALADCVWQASHRESGDQTGVVMHADPSAVRAPVAISTTNPLHPVSVDDDTAW